MARDAIGKLKEAQQMRSLAKGLEKTNPAAAHNLILAAEKKERTAVRMYTRVPKRKKPGTGRSGDINVVPNEVLEVA